MTKSDTLVAVDDGMVVDDSSGIGAGQFENIRRVAAGSKLGGTCEGRLSQSVIADTSGTAIKGQLLAVNGDRFPLLDPDRLLHRARA